MTSAAVGHPEQTGSDLVEAGWRAYLDAALDCVVMADAEGRVVEFNPAAETTFGYARADAVGRLLSELIVPPSLRARHVSAFAHFVETREERAFGRRLEFTGMHADGSEFPVELVLSRVQGEPLLVCGALRDLTERRRAEEDLRRLVDEQAALRRVATLVAQAATPKEIFAAVAEESAGILGVPATALFSWEPDGTAIKVGGWGAVENPFPVGRRYPPHPGVIAEVRKTGRATRLAYGSLSGPIAETLDRVGIHYGLGVPIIVDGVQWGVILALATDDAPLPSDAEARLGDFTELVAVAIANTQARDDLRELANEQAALRRVATQVASGAEPQAVFDAVCEETGRLLGATSTNLAHFTPDHFNLTISGWSLRDTHVPTGTRLPLAGDSINTLIQRTRAPARFDSYEGAAGELAATIRSRGIHSEVGAPVIVDGHVWGTLISGWDSPAPDETEWRLARFAELVATAVSNAATRSQLIASRARIVAASDEARRRIERNLHDGAQQRLVSVGLELQGLRAKLPPDGEVADDVDRIGRAVDGVIDEVREISRGVHPAALSHWGLAPALESLARRAPLPVELTVFVSERLSQSIEIAAYYAVSEALTNVAKHGNASGATVEVRAADGRLTVEVTDDGVGGAQATEGSGLAGLVDRVEALGGHLFLESPQGEGTTISIDLPLLT